MPRKPDALVVKFIRQQAYSCAFDDARYKRCTIFIETSIMRFLTPLLVLLFYSCATSKPINVNQNADSALLYKLEYDAIKAEFAMDTAAVSRVMDNGFINISPDEINSKDEELAGMYDNFRRRKERGHTIDSFYLHKFRADFFDNTAVVTFQIVTKGVENNARYEDKRTAFYDVWVNRNGVWKLVSMQATRVNY